MYYCPECGNVFLDPIWVKGKGTVCPECESYEYEDCTFDYERELDGSECDYSDYVEDELDR